METENKIYFIALSFFAFLLILTVYDINTNPTSAIVAEKIGDIIGYGESTELTKEEVKTKMTSEQTNTGLFSSILDTILNIPYWIGKVIGFILKYGLQFLGIGLIVGSMGGMWALLGIVVFFWQIATVGVIYSLITERG